MKKILVPVDEGEFSEQTAATAIEYAQKTGAEILLLHVQPLSVATYPYVYQDTAVSDEAINLMTERIMANARAKFDDTGLKVATRVVTGYPASEIADCAEAEKCDLIIMRTHGMGAVRRFLLGSVTNKVVHSSNVSVLVLR